MSYDDIRDAREGYVRGDFGDALIKIESVLIGIAVGFAFLYGVKLTPVQCIIIAILVMVVVPWLVGTITILAWIVAILFSLVWAAIGFVAGYFIFNHSYLIGIVTALVIFVLSFFCHKVFAGIGLQSARKFRDEALDDIRNNTNDIRNNTNQQPEAEVQIRFCSSCGAELKEGDSFCNKCGTKQS